MHTWESNFSNFVIKYLGKTETEFQNTSLNFFGGIILFKLGTSIKSENKIHLGCAVLQQEASVWGFIKEKKLTQDLVLNLKICLKLLHNIETYRILNAKYSFLYICTVGWSDLALFFDFWKHVSADQVYFYQFNSKKLAILARHARVTCAAKFSF